MYSQQGELLNYRKKGGADGEGHSSVRQGWLAGQGWCVQGAASQVAGAGKHAGRAVRAADLGEQAHTQQPRPWLSWEGTPHAASPPQALHLGVLAGQELS